MHAHVYFYFTLGLVSTASRISFHVHLFNTMACPGVGLQLTPPKDLSFIMSLRFS